MLKWVLAAAIASAMTTYPLMASAQPSRDELGNYNNIENWQNWVVIPDPAGVYCRKGAGEEFDVATAFEPGTILTVSSSVSPPIQNDPRGKPWLAVNMNGDRCFVRANSLFIQPAQQNPAAVPVAPQSTSDQPRADEQGNYNNTQNWQKWQVIPDPAGLHCRKGPGVEFDIVAAFDPAIIMTVSPDYSPQIQLDPRGNPWLAVKVGNDTCFVRSNSAFIRPSSRE